MASLLSFVSIFGRLGKPVRATLAWIALAIALPILPAYAAVEPVLRIDNTLGPYVLYHPYAVAVDSLGYIYVTDTQHHRIVKYNKSGAPVKYWGSFGSGVGQFAYPSGIAVMSDTDTGATRIYVADTGNSRIVAFNAAGSFEFQFGSLGSGDGQLDHPEGIAIVPPLPGFVRDLCVADTRNARVSCFHERGAWWRTFHCSDCPGSGFVKPVGIAIRRLASNNLNFYVADNYPGIVHVLQGAQGHWLRSFGGPGTIGEMPFPDDVAVDPDNGSAYVVDAGNFRVSKFDPHGNFLFSFNTDGAFGFNQPHGVALDEQGNLYVVNTGESIVDKFKFTAPELMLRDAYTISRREWLDTMGAWVKINYNGVEQTCLARGHVTITAAGQSWTIGASVSGITINADPSAGVKFPLTASATKLIGQVWKSGGFINVATSSTALCQDGTRLSATYTFPK